eukprot:TRINITY_DN2028_c0_g1_i1.p2 TRINITY_DN2028_c0_g1~~TRINITY_DN2028_c0_g1_i1.p2  ORF type:complete len:210 (-),score=92.12 TRINITY_DN2028_c0_g1_i1:1388-2017(-)
MSKFVDNTVRRKWDKAEFDQIAKEQDKILLKTEGKPPPPKRPASSYTPKMPMRAALKAREEEVKLDEDLGKTKILSGADGGAGFFCQTCVCWLKDSQAYLDHINGKKHQKKLGVSMRVERSTVDQVRNRFKAKQDELAGKLDYEARLAAQKEQEEKEIEEKKDKKKEKKEKNKKAKVEAAVPAEDAPQPEDADEVMRAMGITTFGSSKK